MWFYCSKVCRSWPGRQIFLEVFVETKVELSKNERSKAIAKLSRSLPGAMIVVLSYVKVVALHQKRTEAMGTGRVTNLRTDKSNRIEPASPFSQGTECEHLPPVFLRYGESMGRLSVFPFKTTSIHRFWA
ncbi:hypothetical protein K438DRAFT_1783130 [Mycena galopus ATCC 62051]|nr:hypothetical protein K438DRAFT_1783130 [Mycena galopus ATCC 62051]